MRSISAFSALLLAALYLAVPTFANPPGELTCSLDEQLLVGGDDPQNGLWNLRAQLCSNGNWYQAKGAEGQSANYRSHMYIRNMVSQQDCWDATAYIITNCVRITVNDGSVFGKHPNGGRYHYVDQPRKYDEYAEGWFWYSPKKRGIDVATHDDKNSTAEIELSERDIVDDNSLSAKKAKKFIS